MVGRKRLVMWLILGVVLVLPIQMCDQWRGVGPAIVAAQGDVARIWQAAEQVSPPGGDPMSRRPDVVVTRDGTVHVVWQEGDFIYHRYRTQGGWSDPIFVTVGESPHLALGPDDRVHLVWDNEIGGAFKIYYSRWEGDGWSLWPPVSTTSGQATDPAIAVAPDGTVHVVWVDTSPGWPVVYHGWRREGEIYWSQEPVPNATDAAAPDLVVDAEGRIHIVWQAIEGLGGYSEVYYTVGDGTWQGWQLPVAVSFSNGRDSRLPALAVGVDGLVHVVWEEETNTGSEIYYAQGQGETWTYPENASEGASNAYLPSLAVDRWGNRHVAWDEVQEIVSRERGAEGWRFKGLIAFNPAGVAEPSLWHGPGSVLHAVWAERALSGDWDVFYSQRTLANHHLWLAIVQRSGAHGQDVGTSQ